MYLAALGVGAGWTPSEWLSSLLLAMSRDRGVPIRGRADSTGEAGEADGEAAEEATEDRGRFFSFSDGVFAFAATLLAVDLAAPTLRSDELSHLASHLLAMWPSALAYAISFLVVASYWDAHRQLFKQVHGLDGNLIALNSVLLLLIAVLPFPTAVLGLYRATPVAVAFYAATLTAIGLLLLTIRGYAIAKGRLRPRAERQAQRADTLRAVIYPAVFAGSIPIAYVSSPDKAMYFWLLLVPLNALVNRSARRPRAEERRVGPAARRER